VTRGVHHQRGMTLIEVVISIVIVAIAVGAVLGVLSQNARHSADALVLSQAVSIAEA
jgi:MSHA pilin protein MshD